MTPWHHSALEPEHPELAASRSRRAAAIRRECPTAKQLNAISDSLEIIEKSCESPIERQFGTAAAIALSRTSLRIVPQYPLQNYRYDFAILHPVREQVLALVECDGKEFHSTAEQRANDRRKDAAAEEVGTFVIRYSGAAITRDPMDCANNLLSQIRRAWRP